MFDEFLHVSDLGPQHLDQTIKIQGMITTMSSKDQEKIIFKIQSLYNKNGSFPHFVVAEANVELMLNFKPGDNVVVTGKYTGQFNKYKKYALAHIDVDKINPLSDILMKAIDDNLEEEEILESHESFFTIENLSELRFSTSDEFIQILERNANIEGFKLSREHSKKDSYISLRCYLYNTASHVNDKCSFQIRLQAHNFKEPNQYYTISKNINLSHTHDLNPNMFCHLCLDNETKKLIKSMHSCFIDTVKISEYINITKGITLTTSQIRSIIKKEAENDFKTETDELIQKMKDEGGIYFLPQDETNDSNINYRRIIATFTQEELSNLEKFGDFISIDPTYPNLLSNWTLIPLSAIGNSRELISVGCVFCSSVNADAFVFILNLLTHSLPCSSLIQTICSDDDVSLKAAFKRLENDPSVSCIKRIICIWHKCKQFNDVLKQTNLNAEQKKKAKDDFHTLAFSRNEAKCLQSISSLKNLDTKIKDFIVES